jgi:hypothetical protein
MNARSSGPGDEPLLPPHVPALRMSLHPAHGRLLLELLEGSHGVHVEPTSKLHDATSTYRAFSTTLLIGRKHGFFNLLSIFFTTKNVRT